MDADTFIETAVYGETEAALAALRTRPALATSRSASGVSVIASAVYAGRLALAQQIAQTRSDLDLFEAACVGDIRRIGQLLDRDPEAIDRCAPDGFTAAGLAAYFGHLELLRMLIARGADIERPARNAMRVRPLHSAAAHANPHKAVALARVLLEAGANPDAQQEGGMTPLHEAVLNDNLALAEMLLAAGAHPHLSNDEGDSPLQLAQAHGLSRLAERLDRAPLR